MTTPDLESRPHQLTVEREMRAAASALYRAWTQDFDQWFAVRGSLRMSPDEGSPWYFEVEHAETRHPHYGRFLRLRRDRLVVTTWVTAAGTLGHETVVTVALRPAGMGTVLTLTQKGFPTEELRQRAEDAWPARLGHLDMSLT